MFIVGELLVSMAFLVKGIATILIWLLFARIIISWFPVDPYSGIVQFLVQVTDPILLPFRKIPLQIGMLDLSPILAFVVINLVRNILVHYLLLAASQMGAGPSY